MWQNHHMTSQIDVTSVHSNSAIKRLFCTTRNPLYSMINRNYEIHLSRIRIGLRGLNSQRFTDNLTDNSNCDRCHTAFDTPSHYFLQCLTYDAPCQSLRHNLQDLLPTNTSQNKKVVCKLMIYGTDRLNRKDNYVILMLVCEYINKSGRF